jgi:chemotaxis protein MotB
MTNVEQRARKSWLLSFGDVTTLLICFFVMMIGINKGEVARVHVWIEQQLESSRAYMETVVSNEQLTGVRVSRDTKGVLITLNSLDAFESAKTEPSAALKQRLLVLGEALAKTPVFQVERSYPQLMKDASANHLQWVSEIVVEGHTDNDAVLANSRLRSNWELSALRAQRVMQLLQASSGLPEAQFAVAGMGEYHPVSSNDTVEGKAENRRINIRINASLIKMPHLATANQSEQTHAVVSQH